LSDGEPLPLSGVTVADFSWVLAGPRCTSWLGAMGARVIKIEGPKRPDQYRSVAVFEAGKAGIDGSGAFHPLNHTKLGCAIDFGHPKGLALAKRIVAISDVVVENFSHGVMERVGLGYEELRQLKPDVIMVSSSAMGKSGPDKHHVAYGTLIHAFAGLNSVTGYEGESAGTVGGTFADPLTGTTMVLAVLAALWRRRRILPRKDGQLIDLSMVEATMMQLPELVMDYTANGRVAAPRGNDDGIAAPNDCYPCRGEHDWVAISVRSQEEWEAFCGALGRPAWCADPRFADQQSRFEHREALNRHVSEWTRTLSAAAATELLQAAGVAAFPPMVNYMLDADPHLAERGFWVEKEHPEVGAVRHPGIPWRMSGTPCEVWRAAPTLGQDNDYVFGELLGMSGRQIAELVEGKVIF